MCKDTLIDITAGMFVLSVLALCTALFLTTLDGVACGPAAHPSPAWSCPLGRIHSYRRRWPQRDKRGRAIGAELCGGGAMTREEVVQMIADLRALGLDLPEIEYFVRAALAE